MKHKSEMENINLIRRVAWNFHRRFQQYEIDDLIQEAALGYLKGLRTYSPEKGSITTHTWNSMHSPAGFPDLVLLRVRDSKLIFAELKTDRGKLSEKQEVWINALNEAHQLVFVWKPSDWEHIARVLR